MRKFIAAERNRLIQKMIAEKRTGASMAPATPSYHLLTADEDGDGDDDTANN